MNQFLIVLTIIAVSLIVIIGSALIYLLWLRPSRKEKQELSVTFYRRVISISNTIKHCEITGDMVLLNSCKRRIDNDREMIEPEASVIKKMLLDDLSKAIVRAKSKPGYKPTNYLDN